MYNKILVPVDLNEKGFADKATEIAVNLAKTFDAKLYLLNVLPGIHLSMVSSFFPSDAAHQMKQESLKQLKEFKKMHVPDEIPCQIDIQEGKPYSVIVKEAQDLGVDLIILPSHKRSKVDRVMLGTVASKVVEFSPINVMVIKPNG